MATDRTRYKFTVKEYGKGEPWIVLEPMGGRLRILGAGFLGLDLKPSSTYEDAKEIAEYLNAHISAISYTD